MKRAAAITALCMSLIGCSSSRRVTADAEPTDAGHDADAADSDVLDVDAGLQDADAAMAPTPDDLEDAWREAPLFKSGSRLRARVLDVGGPVAALQALHDTELDIDCQIGFAEDGELHCMPGSMSIFYLDADCTQPVMRQDMDWEHDVCEPNVPAFALGAGRASLVCDEAPGSQAYRVGAALRDGNAYELTDGGCAPVGPRSCLHEITAEPAESFVRGEIVTVPRDHGLAVDYVRYEDGAEIAWDLRDIERGLPCTPLPGAAPERCVPAREVQWVNAFFTGADCDSGPVAQDVSRPLCTQPVVIVGTQRDACGSYELSLFELGPEVSIAFERTPAGCVQNSGGYFYELGDPLDTTTLPVLRERSLGDGRLSVTYYSSEDGTPVAYRQPGFFDTELEHECRAMPFADGTLRCTPLMREGNIIGPFLDSACTQRIAPMEALPAGCIDQLPDLIRLSSAEGATTESVHTLGSEVEIVDRTVFYLNGRECASSDIDPNVHYREVGDALVLAVVTERIE